MPPPLAEPTRVLGTSQPESKDSANPPGTRESDGGGELGSDVGALLIAGVVAGVVVLVRRWLRLRSRPPVPGLPRERVLPFSRHGTLHDPKYLGRILEAEDPPAGP
ncbi:MULTISPECIES: hypothetical protein [unclassified Cyanobium]|uniref:hypothetical protein n=1 Tax=unclassified Cyanobium TaxID=2627006 RepID=UPI0020CDD60A|nr:MULTISPECIES: hypothetical protein [unclassified Cyanobium]MCP9832716.1 hypothetical protein [Cyanobium sp. La Preciosa 7G6]MCP9935467.1 hypothetical protein [Cyanobium sp. Aljojuca 7A6]